MCLVTQCLFSLYNTHLTCLLSKKYARQSPNGAVNVAHDFSKMLMKVKINLKCMLAISQVHMT